MKDLTKEVKKEIQEYIENNQPKVYWNNTSDLDTAKEILEKGMDVFIDEIKNEWDEYNPDEIQEFSKDFIYVDINIKKLLCQIPDVTCLVYVYSNYDCCNSMDRFKDGGYLPEVYNRVKVGVKKDDYMYEFHNGAYGGCLFCFAFKTDVKSTMELMNEIKTGKEIFIPKGTQFGFFSSFQGAGTTFERKTYKDMTIPLVGETEYDSIGITPDILQSYSMTDVYGDSSFIDKGIVDIN